MCAASSRGGYNDDYRPYPTKSQLWTKVKTPAEAETRKERMRRRVSLRRAVISGSKRASLAVLGAVLLQSLEHQFGRRRRRYGALQYDVLCRDLLSIDPFVGIVVRTNR
jgi:hypothetical protein